MPFLFLLMLPLFGNNITTSNEVLCEKNETANTVKIQFDISWDNSWRDTENFDAAWVFVKFRVSGGEWQHATLSTSGYYAPEGSSITIGQTDGIGVGAFIYRNAEGGGTFSLQGVKLVWNYGDHGVADDAVVDIKVFAIEMVYIPMHGYWLGDGSSDGSFRQVGANTPVQITLNPTIVKCEDTPYDDTQLEGDGILVDGNDGIDKDGTTEIDNPDYPTGYKAFFCMKYEITQQQYMDFLNTLTRVQQNTRTVVNLSPGVTNVTNIYVMSNSSTVHKRKSIHCDVTIPANDPITFYCDYDGDGVGNESNDGQWIACNFLTWMDGCAYADWAGLRPMTELEFEKVCRGPNSSVGGEYAWGTTSIFSTDYTWANLGTASEGPTNASTTDGNCLYSSTNSNIDGPMRVGGFAGGSTGRVTSGGSYYGVMEMSGNLEERCVTLGKIEGRSYTGLKGNGELSTNGNADVQNWPKTISGEVSGAEGSGLRGSNLFYYCEASSFRIWGAYEIGASFYWGFRCVR